jgi:hypothetical protein
MAAKRRIEVNEADLKEFYPHEEEERIAQEEAFWDELEARGKAAEFLPIDRPGEERVERETGLMLAQEDLQLYAEFGVVR